METQDWDTAVSRAYFAVYHGVIEVMERRGGVPPRARWDHSQLRNEFRSRFTNRGFLFTTRNAIDLDRLYEERLIADYERGPLNQRRARNSVTAAGNLLSRVIEVLGDG